MVEEKEDSKQIHFYPFKQHNGTLITHEYCKFLTFIAAAKWGFQFAKTSVFESLLPPPPSIFPKINLSTNR